jgi:putative sigma-54 modulation protein
LKVNVSARHADVSERARQYAQRKAGKLSKYFDRVQSIEVILDRDHQDWKVEMIATGAHRMSVVAQHSSEDLLAAIDMVIDKAERQLTREKEKKHDHKHVARHGQTGPQEVVGGAAGPEE